MLNYRDIAKIFEEIEIRLISSLKRNLSRHKREENQYGFDWTAWQAEKLRNIDKFRRENSRIMNSYTGVIDSATRQLMTAEFQQGVNGVVPTAMDEPHFFGVDNTKLDKLMDDVVNLEKHAETAVLRTMDDVYRQTVNKAQLAMSTGSITLQQAIDMAVQDFLNKGINCIVYRDGRRVNIADYVRMALRTTATRANLQGMSAKIRKLGYDTILVSSYGMCSETCLPWQGRPYIDDVFSMWDGEIQERSNGELWGKSHYCGKWFPLLSKAINGGLFHPNCRHTITMWRDGDPLPEPQNNSEIQRRYRLEQHQRHLENKVRKAKRFVEGQSDPENLKKAKKHLRDAQKELREFIADTNLNEGETVLKRDYSKEKIYTIDKFSENSKVKSDNPVTIINKSDIDSPKYRNKFDVFGETTKIARCMSQEARKMLHHRTGTLYEDLSFIDSKTGKYITRNDYNVEKEVMPSKRMIKMVEEAEPYSIIAIHNHPTSSTPSMSDINSAWKKKYKYGLIACHNGNIFKYRITGDYNPIIVNAHLDKIHKLIYNKDGTMDISEIERNIQHLKMQNVEFEVFLWQ